ncbi:hypothetical protein J437_LFUL000716 [Ladona fulva]|uniref:Uncharacterized protein n=1 Tax=Ladona fulva TaxID=123851 RepID=A0A8K0NV55_LADFU|nr:hypothetical protein J437_LFUL000716 [Ladona fulva]
MPLLMFNIFGDVIMYQKDTNIFLVEREMTYLLLFTIFLTCALHTSNKEWKIPSFNDIDTSSDYVLKKAWCYLKGYLLFKVERVKEASEVMEMLNFSSFASHFKTKKAILTACILSKDNDHERALSILNCEAMDCEDCMPATLYIISDEYEALGQKESQLQSLRLLFKLLRHKKQMERHSNCQNSIFLKTLDLIPVSTDVTMTKVLQKLASNLAHYELYDESAECFLDLLALLEATGPASSIPHTIHSAAAVLLLIGDSGGVDRSKEAATLCRRAAEILSQNCDIPEKKSSLESSSEYELRPSKRPRLEMHVGTVFMELESGTDEEDAMEIDNREEVENIFDTLSSLSVGVISSSLMSCGRDLTSFILLSECAYREKDFRSCTLLLNR